MAQPPRRPTGGRTSASRSSQKTRTLVLISIKGDDDDRGQRGVRAVDEEHHAGTGRGVGSLASRSLQR